MAGLTREGFTPLSYNELVTRISNRLEAFSPGIDLSPESPDGGLVEIFSFELSQAWSELDLVYNSYNPNQATGAGLRNLGLITGLTYGAATRSQTLVGLVGTAGTPIPRGSVVSDAEGNEFTTALAATIPANVQVVARVSGPINVDAGAILNIESPITGWTSVSHTQSGRTGSAAQTETQFRNLRNKTVLRNFVSIEDTIRARVFETLGIKQVVVLNNDHLTDPLPDGTPAGAIHVTVGEVDSSISDEDIAQVILTTKGLGCPTFGSTSVIVNDAQDNPHTVNFSKAVAQDIWMDINITFLDTDYAGAEESIRADLVAHINSLATDEDVIWSRLFGIITPYSKAQVNSLLIGTSMGSLNPANIPIDANHFANIVDGQISITRTNP